MTPFKGINRVSSPYGPRTLNGVREHHNGMDIVGDESTDVRAIWDCTKVEVLMGYNSGRGNMVILYYSNKIRCLCQHLDKAYITAAMRVKQGDKIGKMGNTGYSFGAHLHIEVQQLQGNKWVPINPAAFVEVQNVVGKHKGNNNLDKPAVPAVPPAPPPVVLYKLEVGPASAGDKNTIEATAAALGLPVKISEAKG